jgi:Uncharacterized protein conserved in bacteria (DUF2252)
MYPKVTAQQGTIPRIIDSLPLIFHPTAEQAPGLKIGYAKALAQYRVPLPENVRSLFDRYVFADLAVKVVGVGSVGTVCMIALFLAANDDPLFLQVKETRASVLEPHVGTEPDSNHGQRLVAGQRLMQSASDIFLGWTEGLNGRHFYLSQLRDAKISAIIEGFDLFDEAICEFAVEYANQNENDYKRFINAVREGKSRRSPRPSQDILFPATLWRGVDTWPSRSGRHHFAKGYRRKINLVGQALTDVS